MPTDTSFTKNIILRFILTLPVYLKGIVVLPMLTKIYPQVIYGVWIQLAVIKEIMIYLLSLRLETAIVRYLSAEKRPENLIKSVFTITSICSLIFVSTVSIFRKEVSQIIFGASEIYIILVVACCWIIVGAFLQVGLAVLRSQEKISVISMRELLAALWLITAVYFAYVKNLEIQTLILMCTAGDSVLLAWILVQIGTPFPFTTLPKSFAAAKKLLPYTFPLIFNTLFLWFTGSIDKFLIVHLINLAALGVYGVALQVSSLLMLVMSPINFVLFPRVTASWNQNDKSAVSKYFSQSVFLTLVLSAPVLVGLLVISTRLIILLAGPEYAVGKEVIVFMVLSEFAKAIYQNHIYVIHLVEKTIYLPFVFIITAAINCATCYVFILHMKFGIAGAAFGRFATFGLMAFIITLWARKHIAFKIEWKTILLVVFSAMIMGLSIFWMPMKNWFQLITVVIAGIAIFSVLMFCFNIFTIDKMVMIKNTFSSKTPLS